MLERGGLGGRAGKGVLGRDGGGFSFFFEGEWVFVRDVSHGCICKYKGFQGWI